jgi:hypothetical protein
MSNTRGRGTAGKTFGTYWQKPRDDFNKVLAQLLFDVKHEWDDKNCDEMCKFDVWFCHKRHMISFKNIIFIYGMTYTEKQIQFTSPYFEYFSVVRDYDRLEWVPQWGTSCCMFGPTNLNLEAIDPPTWKVKMLERAFVKHFE